MFATRIQKHHLGLERGRLVLTGVTDSIAQPPSFPRLPNKLGPFGWHVSSPSAAPQHQRGLMAAEPRDSRLHNKDLL